jgi:hypothetical protein
MRLTTNSIITDSPSTRVLTSTLVPLFSNQVCAVRIGATATSGSCPASAVASVAC